jgi:hypothetical protein
MTNNILLVIVSVLSVGFPWLFLVRYERRWGDPVDNERFKTYRIVETTWLLLLIIGGFFSVFAVPENFFNPVARCTLFISLLAIPTALLAAFTGIYREIGREGYEGHYEKHKDSKKQFFASSRYPTLQVIGWIQFCLLVISTLISFLAMK